MERERAGGLFRCASGVEYDMRRKTTPGRRSDRQPSSPAKVRQASARQAESIAGRAESEKSAAMRGVSEGLNSERARSLIRESGLRATSSRIATLLEVHRADAPVSHPELAERLAASGFDKTTTFRNLQDLVDANLLRRTELGDHLYRFEPIDRAEQSHPHFYCVDCGTVTCLQEVRLTAGSQRSSAEVGQVTEILLRGHCNACQ